MPELPRTGQRISDRYLLEHELGSGGMGTVFHARDLHHDRDVALKVLNPDRTAGLDAERFIAEIRTVARLTHPHIVPVHDSGDHDGMLWYVMPRVEGESLRQRLDRTGPLPIGEAISIASQIADALSYAHGRGVIHRDIKPGNILLDGSGHAYLADFGLARALTEQLSRRRTASGLTVGSPLYMSPEQAVGDRGTDARSDLYSLGSVLYEILAGVAPYPDEDVGAVLRRRLTEDAPSIRTRRADVPPSLDDALRITLSRDPNDRFATAEEFRAAIRPAAATPGAPARKSILDRHLALVGAFMVALILVMGTVFMVREAGVPSEVDATRLAVFPFNSLSVATEDWAEGAPDLLTTMLDGAEGVQVADPWALWRPLRPERGQAPDSPDPEYAAELARGARAYRYLLGSIVESGDSVRLNLRVYRLGRDEPIHVLQTGGVPGDLAGAVRRAAVAVLARLATDSGSALPSDLVLDPTESPEALKAYLAAREAMRRGMVDSAGIAIDRAVALDSTFVLALLEAIHVKSWAANLHGRPYQGLLELLGRIEPFADSLNPRTRLRLESTRASVLTDGTAAAAAAREIIALDPMDIQAWANLTYYRTVYGWQFDASPEQAVEAADRVIELDSTYVPGLVARAGLALALRDSTGSRLQLRRLLAADTTTPLAGATIAALRIALADDAEFEGMIPALADRDATELPILLLSVQRVEPARAARLLRALHDHDDPGARELARGELARLELAFGRPERTDSVAGLPGVRGNRRDILFHALIVGAGINGMAPTELAAGSARELAAYVPVDSVNAYWDSRPVWVAGWLIGAFGATVGDTTVARRWQAVFDTMPEGGSPPRWAAGLSSDLEARLAVRHGRSRLALDAARRAFRDWSIHTESTREFFPAPSIRMHLATLYREASMPDSARALLASLTPPATWLGFLTPRAHFELGDLHLADGRDERAREEFRRALAFWERGGPAVSEWRDQARRAVAGEPRPSGGR